VALGRLATKTTGIGQELTDAVRAVTRENPRLQGVIDVVDFNATTSGATPTSTCYGSLRGAGSECG
jgi:hypothetical protein